VLKAWHCLKQCKRKAPSGWNNNNYWSATPSASGHANVNLNNGNLNDRPDADFRYAAAVL
jgi:hypothetical protein